MKLSIIIPVLNEMAELPHTVAALRPMLPAVEVIIVDGGSTDGTREWLARQTNIHLVTSGRGRGTQQNAGAAVANGDVLLFLHGDCLPPQDFVALIEAALAQPQASGGAFIIRFAEQLPRSLGIIAKGINARTLVTRTATGDQGIFVRREIFDHVGGFANWPFFEDVQLVTKIKRQGRFIIMREPVTISARRYLANGPWRTTFLMYALRLGYWLGIPPATLYRWFQDVRPQKVA